VSARAELRMCVCVCVYVYARASACACVCVKLTLAPPWFIFDCLLTRTNVLNAAMFGSRVDGG
jgi:hypothetical protein